MFRIFDVTTLECLKIAEFEAHDQEILVLEYTDSSHGMCCILGFFLQKTYLNFLIFLNCINILKIS
jgi:hypothetical protein